MSTITWCFRGKTALVTGGSRGIGRAIVQKLAAAGADVWFTYASDAKAAAQLAEACQSQGQRVQAVQADFADPEQMRSFLQRMQAAERIDFVVNNAGLVLDAPFYKMTEEQWHHVLQVNLHALYAVNRQLFRKIAFAKGSIVNLTSVSGLMGGTGQVNYSAAKAGVIGFTKALAREAGSLGVRVSAVAPGYVETDILQAIPAGKRKALTAGIPLRRLGQPDEVANAVLFLLSDEASYITGSVLCVDGGMI